MVAQAARWSVRFLILAAFCIVVFYLGRPLYWKLSATIHDIRENPQALKDGFSDLIHEARKSVEWGHENADSTDSEQNDSMKDKAVVDNKDGKITARKLASLDMLRVQSGV